MGANGAPGRVTGYFAVTIPQTRAAYPAPGGFDQRFLGQDFEILRRIAIFEPLLASPQSDALSR
jgi:hypothetical protein